MGFFSFGKKDDAPRRRGANARSSRSDASSEPALGPRLERRSRRTERAAQADAMLLDPTLPEKQRARRRLVGAIALVIAAVVVLPMVLDSHPKPVTDDIAIDIPNRPAAVSSRARSNDTAVDTDVGAASDRPDGDTSGAASGVAPLANGDATQSVPPAEAAPQNGATPSQAEVKTAQAGSANAGSQPRSATPSAAAKSQQSAAQKQAGKPTTTAGAATADADSGTPAAPPGARYAVQLGVFADDTTARNWETKLKAAGVPAYVEHRKQADGTTRTLLRAGPFVDRAAASAAIAKVREAGLAANAGQ
jgi:DedD protein